MPAPSHMNKGQLQQLVHNLEGRNEAGLTAYISLRATNEDLQQANSQLLQENAQLRRTLADNGIPIPTGASPSTNGNTYNFLGSATVNQFNVYVNPNPYDSFNDEPAPRPAPQAAPAPQLQSAALPQFQLPIRGRPSVPLPDYRNKCTRGGRCRREQCHFVHQDQLDAYGQARIDELPKYKKKD